jgi:myosin heavy subunit
MSEMLSEPCKYSSKDLPAKILGELESAVLRVKKSRRWFQVDPLTRAFIKALTIMKLESIKSILLMKVIIKTIRELKRVVSREYDLVEKGVREAWKLSELASSWGHMKAREWRNSKAYIIIQALTLQWISRLFNSITKM